MNLIAVVPSSLLLPLLLLQLQLLFTPPLFTPCTAPGLLQLWQRCSKLELELCERDTLFDWLPTNDWLKKRHKIWAKNKKKGKREKKTVKIASSKKKKENTLRNDVSRDVHRKCQARAKKKNHDVDVDDASSDVAESSDCVSVCVFAVCCATSRWLCGEGALPASTATATATATLTLLTWTWTWRLAGVFGASWARFMAAFCCCCCFFLFFACFSFLFFSFFFCTFLGTRF